MSDEPTDSGLHIDTDWKEEAAREKERLAQKEGQQTGAGGAVPEAAGFADLVNSIAMQAAIGLGGYEGPGGERIPPNLQLAKHHINMLDLLEQKTKGNLTAEEKRALDAVVYELRMQYVQRISQRPPTGVGGEQA